MYQAHKFFCFLSLTYPSITADPRHTATKKCNSGGTIAVDNNSKRKCFWFAGARCLRCLGVKDRHPYTTRCNIQWYVCCTTGFFFTSFVSYFFCPIITHSLHYLCNHAVHKAPILITMGLDYIATGKPSAAVVFCAVKSSLIFCAPAFPYVKM